MPASHPPGALQASPRVHLRRPRPEDQDAFLALNRASARHHAGWVSPALTPEAYARKLERCQPTTSKACSSSGVRTTP